MLYIVFDTMCGPYWKQRYHPACLFYNTTHTHNTHLQGQYLWYACVCSHIYNYTNGKLLGIELVRSVADFQNTPQSAHTQGHTHTHTHTHTISKTKHAIQIQHYACSDRPAKPGDAPGVVREWASNSSVWRAWLNFWSDSWRCLTWQFYCVQQ